jgi:hypothetical protein
VGRHSALLPSVLLANARSRLEESVLWPLPAFGQLEVSERKWVLDTFYQKRVPVVSKRQSPWR